MTLYAIGDREPTIDPTAFVHPDAVIIGDVTIGPESTVWPSAVLRGDHGAIRIGARTSVQDGAVIHCTKDHDTVIGADCTIGHCAHLEGCTVEDECLIGSNSVVLHRAVIRTGALVGACAMVPNDREVPPGAMALGVPAKIRPDAVPPGANLRSAQVYVHNSHWYRAELRRLD
jgi:carbonic anhydrase/acetyltransferase-like protein (isoleucine patch superfamily)